MNVASLSLPQISSVRRPAAALTGAAAIIDHGALHALVGDIVHACLGPVDAVPASVAQALERAAWLEQHLGTLPALTRTGAGAGYTRHVLHGDPLGRFTIVAIVWEPRQFSPVHAHHTWCAYHVLCGTLSEKHYSWDAGTGLATYARTVTRLPGDSCAGHAGLEQIHSLGNSGDVPAISVHVYGIDFQRIATHVNRMVTAPPH